MKQNFFKKILVKKWISIPVAIIILVVILSFIINGNGEVKTESVRYMTLTEQISVSGKVAPEEKLSLAFERSGIIGKVNVKVGDKVKKGDLLVEQNNGEILASYNGSLSDVKVEEAKLSEMVRGTREEELEIYKKKYESAKVSENDAVIAVKTAISSAYVSLDRAFLSYIDPLFDNPKSVNPTIKINFSADDEREINDAKLILNERLDDWQKKIKSESISFSDLRLETRNILDLISGFSGKIDYLVNDLSTTNSGATVSEIEVYRSSVNSFKTALNTQISNLNTAESTYRSAEANRKVSEEEYQLKLSGSTEEEMLIQIARLEKAKAVSSGYWSQLKGTRVYAPIDGVVTKVEAKEGEIFSAGMEAVSIMTDGVYKVEVKVPEVDINKISIGDYASITLDAYGKNTVFEAKVSRIDPAEVVFEGVPSYLVTITFDSNDSRIRSGMTANAIIKTEEKNALAIPLKALVGKGLEKKVKKVKNNNIDEYDEVNVEIGIRGINGYGEVISGLNEGDLIIVEDKK